MTFASDPRAVADLLELRNELAVTAFLANDRAPALPADIELARGQRATEHDTAGVLADVDEAADTDDPVTETADVDVALRVDFGEGKEGKIETSAVIEIELR